MEKPVDGKPDVQKAPVLVSENGQGQGTVPVKTSYITTPTL